MIDIRPQRGYVDVRMTEKQLKMLYHLCCSIGGGRGKEPLYIDDAFATSSYMKTLREEFTDIISDELYDMFGDLGE